MEWSENLNVVMDTCWKVTTQPNASLEIGQEWRHGAKRVNFLAYKGLRKVACLEILLQIQISNTFLVIPLIVFCPFPGFVENGKVLLVGAMGLYEYRPYVRKIRNNRQIMFQCNREHLLVGGPTGATCIDGHWSPPQLPR